MNIISDLHNMSLSFALFVLVPATASSSSEDKVILTNGRAMVTWEHRRQDPAYTPWKRSLHEGHDLRCRQSREVSLLDYGVHKVVTRSDEAFREDMRLCMTHERLTRQIMTGTRWCGNGNNSKSYDDLGYFSNVDNCCRDHDHCDRYVVASKTAYGVTNDTPYTWSDCQCDDEFRTCLQAVDSFTSSFVGKTFFDMDFLTTSRCLLFDNHDPHLARAVDRGSYETKPADRG